MFIQLYDMKSTIIYEMCEFIIIIFYLYYFLEFVTVVIRLALKSTINQWIEFWDTDLKIMCLQCDGLWAYLLRQPTQGMLWLSTLNISEASTLSAAFSSSVVSTLYLRINSSYSRPFTWGLSQISPIVFKSIIICKKNNK